jgi:TonB-dependent SusC/RagA subfamily outer membrane receptor
MVCTNKNVTPLFNPIKKYEKNYTPKGSLLPEINQIRIVMKVTALILIATTSLSANAMLHDTKIIADLKNANPIISLKNPIAQFRTITGKVTDETRTPLSGVSVEVKGSNVGALTDTSGKFQLEVPDNAVLKISFVGYETQEVTVGNQTSISIRLKLAVAGLSEVVVVGYGTQKKINLTGAISTIKYDETLENRPITNASQALSGQVPGMWISQNSGAPGSDAAQIRVRGWGTLNNSNPLVLIDGTEGSINEINPNDIESMTILKDAASSAIYGSKAANGVILITLKSGSYNGKTQVKLPVT